MPKYKYSAVDASGKEIKGAIEADDKSQAIAKLKAMGNYPLDVQEESIYNKDINISFLKPKVTTKDIAVFCRQFSAMLDAGVSILEAIDVLKKQIENKKLKSVMEEMFTELQRGRNLSDIMRKYADVFPEILINMVEAGEVSGQLDIVMDRMANHFEKEHKLKQKVTSSMTYPVMLILISGLVVWFLITFVLPNFINMFNTMGIELPFMTRMLLAVGAFFRKTWFILVGLALVSPYLFMRYYATKDGRYRIDDLKLKIPLFGIVNKKVATARFARTLSTLLASGITIIDAMSIVERIIGNAIISEKIGVSMEQIKKGSGISRPLEQTGIFPPMLISMIHIGEESGNLVLMLQKTADFYDDEVENALARLTTVIEPLIILVMALVVGMIVIAIITPMFDLFQNFAG